MRLNKKALTKVTITIGFILLSVLALFFIFYSTPKVSASGENWWNTSFANRIQITFSTSGLAENLTNFPVLIMLNSTRIDYTKTNDSGKDIRFVDADNTTKLPYEIEIWNETNQSFVWVNIPNINVNATDYIWIYYNYPAIADEQNRTGTWNSNFKGVWHLGNGTTINATDSTSNNNNGTVNGNPVATSGQIDGAVDFDGTGDYIGLGSGASLDFLSSITLSGWVKPASLADKEFAIFSKGDGGTANYMFGVGDWYGPSGSDTFWSYIKHPTTSAESYGQNNIIVTGTTYYLVMTWAGGTNTMKLYKNGVEITYGGQVAPVGSRNDDSALNGSIGGRNGGILFNGDIDEVRVSNSVRSASWIKAEYNTTTDTFNTYGTSETQDSCTCTNSSAWTITGGDQCTLTNACNLGANKFRVMNGALRITSTGKLIAQGCYVQNSESLFVQQGCGLICR